MSVTARPALVGAAAGAILTLLLHPVSRPYLGVVFWHPPAVDSSVPLRGERPKRLRRPETLIDASIWLQTACERIEMNKPLRQKEIEDSAAVAVAAARADTDNAYWEQMAAVFLSMDGRTKEANESWRRASRRTRWRDLQSDRMLLMKADLESRYTVNQSWQFAEIYRKRSQAPVQAIEKFARTLLNQVPVDTPEGMSERYVTLLNGYLIRVGAQSVATGAAGASIVEVAVTQPKLTPSRTSKSEAAKVSFKNALLQAGRQDEAREAEQIFKENDAWKALASVRDPTANVVRLSYASIIAAAAPSAMLALSLVGLIVWALGAFIHRSQRIQAALRYPGVFSIGLSLAFATYSLTFTPLAGLAIGLCAAFLAFTPRNERRVPLHDLGSVFHSAVWFLSLSFMSLLGLFFMVGTPPSIRVLTTLNEGIEASANSPALVGLSLLVLGLLMLMAPFWAYAQKMRTSAVLSIGLRSFGSLVATICLVGSIVMTLLSIYFDRALGDTLNELSLNEPAHYYIGYR